MSRSTTLIVCVGIVLAACGGSGSTGAAPPAQASGTRAATSTPYPTTRLVVGYDGQSISTGPMRFTLEQGIFKKYGLEVDMRFVAGGSTLTAAIVGGDMPVAQNGYQPALTAALQGADLVIIGGISNKLPFQLITNGRIASLAQLKGSNAKLAISTFGSSSDIALRAILKSAGIDDKKDVTILPTGGEPERTAALESGAIDGTVLQPPTTGVLEKKGYRILANASNVVDVPNTSYVTSRKYLKSDRDVVKRFLMAMLDGVHAYKTDPTAAIASTAAFLKVSVDDMKPAYDFYVKEIFPDELRPSMSGIKNLFEQTISQTNPAAKTANPSDYVDQSILDELEREGFFKTHLGR